MLQASDQRIPFDFVHTVPSKNDGVKCDPVLSCHKKAA